MTKKACLLVLLLAPVPAAAKDLDWNHYQEEAVRRLSEYLRVDTFNPPGNEDRAARFFQEWFRQEGIPTETLEVAPGRSNLIARLEGSGPGRALILANHADVVQADRSGWKVDPLSGAIVEGRLYGRGALDMKDTGLFQAMVLVALHREKIPLARDVIFLMTADEEVDFLGAQWLIEHKPDLFRESEFIITEGGLNLVLGGKLRFFGIDTGEKAPFWLKLVATGTPGHGSIPKRNAASHRLARALAKVVDWETPIVVTPGVEKFFRDVAPLEQGKRAEQFRHLREAIRDADFQRSLTEDENYNFLLRNTVSLTVLQGGPQTNVIPGTAIAHLDVRLLPGQDPEDFLKQLRAVIQDPEIRIEPITDPFLPASESSTDTDFFRAVEKVVKADYPGEIVTTTLLSGATECSVYRATGVQCYGFEPILLTPDDLDTVHGNNENISIENIHRGFRLLFEVVSEVAG